jgi:hypothetical protein
MADLRQVTAVIVLMMSDAFICHLRYIRVAVVFDVTYGQVAVVEDRD